MMKVQVDDYVRLTEEYLFKLDVISSAIIEDKTKKELVEGGIDIMFANATHNLYEDGEITNEGLDDCLDLMPEFLADKVKNDLDLDDK